MQFNVEMTGIDKWKVFCFAFRFVCSVITVIMVGYWIYKFQKNEDVSTIEYQYINESNYLRIPEMTICIRMPFIKEKFRELGLDPNRYYLYLKGEKNIEEDYRKIDLNDVTIDIRDYVQQIRLAPRNDATGEFNDCKTTNTCSSFKWNNNFNGFWNQVFVRCYGFEIIPRFYSNIKRVIVSFNPELARALNDSDDDGVFVIFNYPQHMLRNLEDIHAIWDSDTKIRSMAVFKIPAMEVIIRRNRPSSPCFTGWKHFDNSVFEKYTQEATCTVPYQKGNKSVCSTSEEMVDSKYSMNELRNKYFSQPCHEMSNLISSMNTIERSNFTSPQLYVTYPDKIKVITQHKSVDAHMLIGNIGGYIGLLLGNAFLHLLHCILKIYLHYQVKYCCH